LAVLDSAPMPTPEPTPLGLTDEQLALVRAGAEPIPSERRGSYLHALVAALPRGEPLTNAMIRRALAVAQREVLASAIGVRPKRPASVAEG
jgi:hypothetical protein